MDNNVNEFLVVEDMTGENTSLQSQTHGRLVEYRFDAYHDVKVYEDGYEEKYYIGD